MSKLEQILAKCVPEEKTEYNSLDACPKATARNRGHNTCRQTVLNNLPTVEAELLDIFTEAAWKYVVKAIKSESGAREELREDLKAKLTNHD